MADEKADESRSLADPRRTPEPVGSGIARRWHCVLGQPDAPSEVISHTHVPDLCYHDEPVGAASGTDGRHPANPAYPDCHACGQCEACCPVEPVGDVSDLLDRVADLLHVGCNDDCGHRHRSGNWSCEFAAREVVSVVREATITQVQALLDARGAIVPALGHDYYTSASNLVGTLR